MRALITLGLVVVGGLLFSQLVTLFLTPVIFVSDHIKNPWLHRLIMINPLTYLVEVPRSVLLAQETHYWPQYWGASAMCLVILLLGVKIFDMVQDLVAERL